MARYTCIECQMIQSTGRVCSRCGGYSLESLETHDSAPRTSKNPPARTEPSNTPVWLSLIGIAFLTSYLLVFHL